MGTDVVINRTAVIFLGSGIRSGLCKELNTRISHPDRRGHFIVHLWFPFYILILTLKLEMRIIFPTNVDNGKHMDSYFLTVYLIYCIEWLLLQELLLFYLSPRSESLFYLIIVPVSEEVDRAIYSFLNNSPAPRIQTVLTP